MSTEQSPSPSQVGFGLGRRKFVTAAAGAAGVVAVGGALGACGSDAETVTANVAADPTAVPEAAAAADPTAVPEATGATGELTIGSNASDDAPEKGLAAVVASFPNKNVDVTVNTLDHNTYQEQITNILQAGEDDVLAWFAGFRNKFFADQGLLGDLSDVWAQTDGLGAGFKAASTASDGKQYFIPTSYYTWAVNYSKTLFETNGYTEPTNKDELVALAEQMMSDGVTPFVFANDGQWPIMGTFDALNMRTNGYDFHIDLMGGNESWTDERVRNVFTTWAELLPFHQEGANGRTWQEGAQALQDGTAGMYLLGTFAASHSEELAADMDFFNFPELDSAIGAGSLDAPIDGYQMIKNPKNAEAAKELLLHMSSAVGQDAYLTEDPSVVASNSNANTSVYNDLQKKSVELASAATGISQFLDRDTIPDFAGECGNMFAAFIEDPTKVESQLEELEGKKQAIFADYGS